MAKAHSSRKRPTRRARIDSTAPQSEVPASDPADPPDFSEILGRFSDGLALVETAHSALENAQEDETSISPGVLTLKRGIDELLSAYNEFDVALSKCGYECWTKAGRQAEVRTCEEKYRED